MGKKRKKDIEAEHRERGHVNGEGIMRNEIMRKEITRNVLPK